MRSIPERLRGFAIVSAIFILVVLATLGAFILNVSTNLQIGSALDVQGVRAYQAARAGIEWGLHKQWQTVPASCAAAASFAPAAATLTAFTVSVTCSASAPACGASTVPAGSFAVGSTYSIQTVGTTDFTLIGAANNTIGTAFVARGVGAGTGSAVGCEPMVYSIVSTACNQPNAGACPNIVNPGPTYVERRLSVAF
jgi:MSHA biogenesis protein MshP